jgi:NAD(P)-dependent dehydrogenase (short-subunit alcohol dehydrogenase family)
MLSFNPVVQTPGNDQKPRDAANIVRFLLSDEGGWLTSQFLQSDGGSPALPGHS